MADIKKNETYTLDITGMTHEGQGVGRIEGFTVFVGGALEGETVSIIIIKLSKNYAVGKLLEILKESPERTKPFCGIYERCGGCSLQHLKYEKQLEYKTGVVREALRRIGKLEDIKVHNTIGMTEPESYRNKAQYPVGIVKGSAVSGFFARRSHDIIDGPLCGIQLEENDRARAAVMGFISGSGVSVYDEKTGKGLVRHIVTRVGRKTGEVMVVLVINGDTLPKARELVELLNTRIPEIKSIYININKKNTNVIFGEKSRLLYGEKYITDYIGDFKFMISPLSFFQVNPVQTEVLYGKALEYAALTGSETVMDIYCGIGTISLFLSKKAGKVYGVEVVEEAIADAKRNAELNDVRNVEFLAGEAEKVIPELYEKGVKANVVVLDPPRKGCDEGVLRTLVDMGPERIVYVSCDPSTLARDLRYLCDNGFQVVEVQPVDMFLWTHHVETIVLIQRAYT